MATESAAAVKADEGAAGAEPVSLDNDPTLAHFDALEAQNKEVSYEHYLSMSNEGSNSGTKNETADDTNISYGLGDDAQLML